MKKVLFAAIVLFSTVIVFTSCGTSSIVESTESSLVMESSWDFQSTNTTTKPPDTAQQIETAQLASDVSYLSNLSLEEIFAQKPSPKELLEQMETNGIEVTGGWDEFFNRYLYTIDTPTVSFSFEYDEARNLVRISTSGDNAPTTARGAKIGDSKERILELYGDDYPIRNIRLKSIEYSDGDVYLLFGVSNTPLWLWEISNESLPTEYEEDK